MAGPEIEEKAVTFGGTKTLIQLKKFIFDESTLICMRRCCGIFLQQTLNITSVFTELCCHAETQLSKENSKPGAMPSKRNGAIFIHAKMMLNILNLP